MKILNATQHQRTADQVELVDLQGQQLEVLKTALTLGSALTKAELLERATLITALAQEWRYGEVHEYLKNVWTDGNGNFPQPDREDARHILSIATTVMVGGHGGLLHHLIPMLEKAGFTVVHAFSVRQSVETTDPVTGVVTKTAVFKHDDYIGLK